MVAVLYCQPSPGCGRWLRVALLYRFEDEGQAELYSVRLVIPKR